MKDLSRSSSSREELLENEPLKDGFPKAIPLDDFSFEYGLPSDTPSKDLSSDDNFLQAIPLDDFSFEYGLPSDTPLKDLSSDDGSPKAIPLDDFSFEYGLPSDTPSKDLSSDDGSPKATQTEDLSLEDDTSREGLFEEDQSEEDEDTYEDTIPIRHSLKSSWRAAIEWCDEVTNTQDDFITNFKSHLPFVVVLAIIILLLWVLRIFYG
jgi:hypothetical protein